MTVYLCHLTRSPVAVSFSFTVQVSDAPLKFGATGIVLNESRRKVPQAGSVREQETFSVSVS